jgi:hypothetical protein
MMTRRLAAGIGIATLVALPLTGSGMATADGCSGAGCKGLDPYSTHCADDGFIASLRYFTNPAGSGRNELFFSPRCRANWSVTRVYSGPSDNMWSGVWERDGGGVTGEYAAGAGHTDATYPYLYSPMVDGSTVNCSGGINVNTGDYENAEPDCH